MIRVIPARSTLTALALLAAATLGPELSRPLLAQNAAPHQSHPAALPGTVSASGTARVYRTPEYLDIHLGVEVQAATATEAQTICTGDMEKVLARLSELGLEKYEPQTGTITLTPVYTERYNTPDERKIVGYRATNTLRVRTTDLKAAPRTVDAALKAGANRVDGIEFGIKEYLEAREEALVMASRAAKRKAEVMAGAVGHTLARVVSLTESTTRYGGWSNRMAQVQAVNDAGHVQDGPGDSSVVPGQIEIVVTVDASFEVRPAGDPHNGHSPR